MDSALWPFKPFLPLVKSITYVLSTSCLGTIPSLATILDIRMNLFLSTVTFKDWSRAGVAVIGAVHCHPFQTFSYIYEIPSVRAK